MSDGNEEEGESGVLRRGRGRPKKAAGRQLKTVSVRLTPDVLVRVDERAARLGKTRGKFLRRLVEDGVGVSDVPTPELRFETYKEAFITLSRISAQLEELEREEGVSTQALVLELASVGVMLRTAVDVVDDD